LAAVIANDKARHRILRKKRCANHIIEVSHRLDAIATFDRVGRVVTKTNSPHKVFKVLPLSRAWLSDHVKPCAKCLTLLAVRPPSACRLSEAAEIVRSNEGMVKYAQRDTEK